MKEETTCIGNAVVGHPVDGNSGENPKRFNVKRTKKERKQYMLAALVFQIRFEILSYSTFTSQLLANIAKSGQKETICAATEFERCVSESCWEYLMKPEKY